MEKEKASQNQSLEKLLGGDGMSIHVGYMIVILSTSTLYPLYWELVGTLELGLTKKYTSTHSTVIFKIC